MFLENDLKWLEICTRFFHGWNFLILGAAMCHMAGPEEYSQNTLEDEA